MSSLLTKLNNWLDDRTGYRALAHEAMYENIPGGSRWIYITGSMLVFAFVTQAVTGIFLWMSYSPGSQNAWESVYYITHEMQGGALLRGVHHYMAQFMVVLLPLHLLQVVLCRAYVAPREINYWLGLVLMLLVLGLGLTGYLLPWDQKGYWATKVATELMALPPGGEIMQKLAVGGNQYGHATLTRFFAMHAGVLPALLVIVLGLHVAMFRKYGITAKSSPKRADEYFWPKQVFKDAVGCLLLLVAAVALSLWKEAELGPPAEPTQSYGAARPEWYFLFLFQLLKKFKSEFVGAIVVPSLVMAFLFALPLIARKIRFGHLVNVVVILVLIMGAGYLTYEAVDHDSYDTRYGLLAPADKTSKEYALWKERVEAAEQFHESQELAHHESQRLRDLITFYGIPRVGANVGLVKDDPEIQGPRIFRRSCVSCHSYLDENGHGIRGPKPPDEWDGETPYGGPNLYGFATPDWFLRFLDPDKIAGDQVFGLTKHKGDMMDFVQAELADLDDKGKATIAQIAATLSAEANLAWRQEAIARDRADGTLDKGVAALQTAIDAQACTDCHKFHALGEEGLAPDLTDYGSYDWLYGFIANPMHPRFYGEEGNDRMPAFAEHDDRPELNLLSRHELDMLVRWLRGDDRDLSLKLKKTPSPATSAATSGEPAVAPETDAAPKP